jgi:hypothetical protein
VRRRIWLILIFRRGEEWVEEKMNDVKSSPHPEGSERLLPTAIEPGASLDDEGDVEKRGSL